MAGWRRYSKEDRSRKPNDDTSIHYAVIGGEGQNTQMISPFRGHNIADLSNSDFLYLAAHGPKDVRDFIDLPDRRLLLQAYGRRGTFCWNLTIPELSTFAGKINPQFLVVRFNMGLYKHIVAFEKIYGWPIFYSASRSFEFPNIHAETLDPHGIINGLRDYCFGVLDLIGQIDTTHPLCAALKGGTSDRKYFGRSSQVCGMHAATFPNDALAFCGGRKIRFEGVPLKDDAPDPKVFQTVAQQCTQLLKQRERARRTLGLKSGFANDIILFYPNIYTELQLDDARRGPWIESWYERELSRVSQDEDLLRLVKERIGTTQKNPFEAQAVRDFVALENAQQTFVFGVPAVQWATTLLQSDEGREIVKIRTAEIFTSTAFAAMLATTCASPVLRLSSKLNDATTALVSFTDLYRKINFSRGIVPAVPNPPERHPQQDAVADAFNDFQRAVRGAIPREYLHIVERSWGVKCYCDFPLEWVRRDVLPYSLSREFSRIPTTPGNLSSTFLRYPHLATTIRAKHISTITVLTNFGPDDPLSGDFCRQLNNRFNEFGLGNILEDVLVRTPKEFIQALSDAPGEIVIVDMHGDVTHDLLGAVYLGDNGFTSAEYSAEFNRFIEQRQVSSSMPSIVILSACDTMHPLSSGFSFASALLASGVTTVLATLLPINAARSTFVIGKIILETVNFLDSGGEHDTTWRNMVCDQMCYAASLELFGACQQIYAKKYATPDEYLLALRPVVAARTGAVNGIEERILCALSAEFDPDVRSLKEILRQKSPFVDTMNYVQLGFPERIALSGTIEGTRAGIPTEIDLFAHQ